MILVLGSTGFLGKTVCRLLDKRGLEYSGSSLSLGIDLRDKESTFHLFEEVEPEYVLNCASFVGGIQFGYKYPVDLFQNNLRMNTNILHAVKEFKVKRLVNPISNCVYPATATLFREDEIWNGEMHESVRVYGYARKSFLIAAFAYKKQYNIDIVNIVLSNMYGPGDHFEEVRSHAIGALIMKMAKAKKKNIDKVCVWGTGTPVREWLYIEDGAEAIVRALNMCYKDGPVNVGRAEGISVKDLAALIKESIGYTGELEFDVTMPDGAPYKTVDGSLGKKLLGFEPRTEVKEGIALTVAWYMENYYEQL